MTIRSNIQTNENRRIAVVGAGAVGCYFGAMLARAGMQVTLIGRRIHVDAIRSAGLLLEGSQGEHERVHVEASTDLDTVHDSTLVLFCVKSYDTEETATRLSSHLAPGALVLSLQNGVDNVERLWRAGRIAAGAAVVYVAAAMVAPGHVKHSGGGSLVIGPLADGPRVEGLEEVATLFSAGHIPCRLVADIGSELWSKMVINCAFNAISALGRARYGRMMASAATRDLMRELIEEAVEVARSAGTTLSATALTDSAFQLGESMSGASSSTAQDIARGNRTEIDSLNGYIVRRGNEFGLRTPANRMVYTLVKLLEESMRT